MIATSGWRTPGRLLIGKRTPESRNCGTMTSGMNWMICSSVRAKVERKMPRLTAPRAASDDDEEGEERAPGDRDAEADRERRAAARWPGRGRSPSAQAMRSATWIVANSPKPERVAGDDLAARDRGRHEALERAAGPLPQEADAGQEVDEEVGEEADDRRREAVIGSSLGAP